jgi:oligosaccharide reducing-end xylanase
MRPLLALGAAMTSTSCGHTIDSLGDNGEADAALGDAGTFDGSKDGSTGIVYPNAFRDLLGKTNDEITGKLTAAFAQLFHGDPTNEAVYFPVGTSQAYIWDVFLDFVSAESLGYGMMITLQLDKKDEFDRLWNWTKTYMQLPDGPFAGLLRNTCPTAPTPSTCSTALDPYGTSYVATSLLFASRRWGSGSGIYNYASEAQSMLTAMPILFDMTTGLAVAGLAPPFSQRAAPSDQIPAFAEIWSRTSPLDVWRTVPGAARAFWKVAAHPVTGLVPGNADFSGVPVPGLDQFGLLAYPFAMDLTMDHIWFGLDPWQVEEADRVIAFFTAQGIANYADRYTLDGIPQDTNGHTAALLGMNGAIALTATTPDRIPFMQAVWDAAIPTGQLRYADGILYMLSLLVLSGNFRMY